MNEKPSKLSILAAISGLVGVGLLVLGPTARLDRVGIVAAIAGAATMGLGTVLVKRWKRPVSLSSCLYSMAVSSWRNCSATNRPRNLRAYN